VAEGVIDDGKFFKYYFESDDEKQWGENTNLELKISLSTFKATIRVGNAPNESEEDRIGQWCTQFLESNHLIARKRFLPITVIREWNPDLTSFEITGNIMTYHRIPIVDGSNARTLLAAVRQALESWQNHRKAGPHPPPPISESHLSLMLLDGTGNWHPISDNLLAKGVTFHLLEAPKKGPLPGPVTPGPTVLARLGENSPNRLLFSAIRVIWSEWSLVETLEQFLVDNPQFQHKNLILALIDVLNLPGSDGLADEMPKTFLKFFTDATALHAASELEIRQQVAKLRVFGGKRAFAWTQSPMWTVLSTMAMAKHGVA
jgi:hypothetical protein